MKRFSVAIGACLVALFCQGTVAQQAPKPGVKEPAMKAGQQKLKVITPEFRKQILQYMQFRRFLYTDPIDCNLEGDKGDICPILVQLVQVSDASGTKYCVGLAPERVKLRYTPGNDAKRIVWKLVLPDPPVANAEFFFHGEDDHGILWLSNFGSPKQMHTGRLGDGSPGSPDRTKFNVMNRHKVAGEAVYVPIILQKDTVTGKISLCGTPDPLIENVP